MHWLVIFLISFLLPAKLFAQDKACEYSFVADTLTLPDGKHVEAERMQMTTKNNSIIQLYSLERKRYFVRIYITENFYFEKTDQLTVESGKWTYPAKNCKQHKISKTMGMYVFEVQKNYLATLRDNGISGLEFAGAKTDFTRSDGQHSRAMSKCFYENLFGKK